MAPFVSARVRPEPHAAPSSGTTVVLFAPYARVRDVADGKNPSRSLLSSTSLLGLGLGFGFGFRSDLNHLILDFYSIFYPNLLDLHPTTSALVPLIELKDL